MKTVRVAAVQMQHRPGNVPENLNAVRRITRRAVEQGAELVVFPECCVSGYWHLRNLDRSGLLELAEQADSGPTMECLASLARELQVTVGAGFVELADSQLYNSYTVVMPDGSRATHRKLHCFVSSHMSSGDQYTVFDTPFGRCGVLICYDNNIIENVRACALQGAEILLAPHQTGGCDSGSPFAMGVVSQDVWDRRLTHPEEIEAEFRGDKGRAWLMRWLPARAHDNGLFLIFANGVGPDDDEVRTGNAMILDPYGRILSETWAAEEKIVLADLDPTLRDRCTGVRWIRARRPSLYGPLTQDTGREEDTRAVRFEHLRSQRSDPPGE
ncbi:MAG TPA: acyltransferase [Planctomycetes bacterium]|jgi:predicted amidohydrolase|nr:acyltransferase [Planctomycetaceae bacterium]HIM30340.1 acyltransferase [Planctomycetota bacterium]